MSRSNQSHPDPEQLAAFATGQVPEDVAAAISLHLADCGACRTAVDALPEDTLLGLLREPPEPAGVPAEGPGVPEAAMPTGPAAAAPTALEPPPELTGHPRYQLQGLLGTGGMGAVYRAEHRLMERSVALKVINPDLMRRPALVERFHREVKAAARLTHPNIVTAYDADQAGTTHFLVMEFVEGISLAQLVQQRGRLPVAEACDCARQAALGLHHAFERGMVHRDIKPHNLMRTAQGQVKILDFGLARLVRETASAGAEAETPGTDTTGPAAGLTEVGVLMGTADFIAPEQADDPRRADIRADIYSLGCTLYYLLTGRAPFPEGTSLDKLKAHRERAPKPLGERRGDIPAELARVIERMMAKEPAKRYQTPAEAAEALKPFSSPKPSPRRARRLVAAAALLAGAILAGGLVYVQTDRGQFVIETADDQVALMINRQGVKIYDRAAHREYLLKVGKQDIRSGTYEIDVRELPDGVEFATTTFTLKRGDKATAVATFKGKANAGSLRDEALNWFPAEATFFGGRDMRVFPDLSVQQILVLTQLAERLEQRERDRFWKLLAIVGRIDRITFAYAADRERPEKSRIFIRVTGSINHQRLAGWFRQEWPGVIIREQKGPRGEPITLVGSSYPVAPAFALVGNTDLILAAYQGLTEQHPEVVQQALDLRVGRGASLPGAHGGDLTKVPASAWTFMVGEPPAALKDLLVFRTLPRTLPRTAVLAVTGAKDITIHFEGSFPTAADARAFAAHVAWLKQQGENFLKNPPVKLNPQHAERLAKTIDGVRMEAEGDQVRGSAQISGEALEALVETLRDLPLSLFNQMIGRPADTRKPG